MQKRHWVFTVNPKHVVDDPSELSMDELIEEYKNYWTYLQQNEDFFHYVSGQIERAETGMIHIQGYVEFKKSKRLTEAYKIVSAHLEPRRADRETARAYTKKSDSRVLELPDIGEWRSRKSSEPTMKHEAIQMIASGLTPGEILMRKPDVYFTHWRNIEAVYGKMIQEGISAAMLTDGHGVQQEANESSEEEE